MAIEAYRSLYGDLAKLKDASLLDLSGPADDAPLFQLLMAVSEAVDNFCNRRFYAIDEPRRFDGNGDALLPAPDLISVASLATDDDEDGEYETAWAPSDYELLPLNASPAKHWGSPYNAVRVRPSSPRRQFARGQARIRIAGRWGYGERLEASGSALSAAAGSASASLSVDRGADFAAGQTLALGAERVLVTSVSENALTVTRGLNGTRPAAHANGAAVQVVRWPAPVERAALINAARIWTRAPAFEPFYVGPGLDSDVRMLLEPYRLGAA